MTTTRAAGPAAAAAAAAALMANGSTTSTPVAAAPRELSAAALEKILANSALGASDPIQTSSLEIERIMRDGVIADGTIGTISGKLKVPTGDARAAAVDAIANQLFGACIKKTQGDDFKLITPARVERLPRGDRYKELLKVAVMEEERNTSGLRSRESYYEAVGTGQDLATPMKTLFAKGNLGGRQEVEIVKVHGKGRDLNDPDRRLETELTLVINKTTGKFVGTFGVEGTAF